MKLLFESFYKKITKASGSKMGRFCIAVPTDITEVEKRAFYDVVAKSDIKAREIKIVEKPIADAVGLQIDMNSQKGNLIVNIGADTTEISVISMGGIVVSRIIKLGGNNIDQMICDVVKRRYNIYIGLRTAEKIKIALADAIYSEDENNENDILYVPMYLNEVYTVTDTTLSLRYKFDYSEFTPFEKEKIATFENYDELRDYRSSHTYLSTFAETSTHLFFLTSDNGNERLVSIYDKRSKKLYPEYSVILILFLILLRVFMLTKITLSQ